LKGRIIKYKPVAKLSRKDSKMRGGDEEGNIKTCFHYRADSNSNNTNLRRNLNSNQTVGNTKLRKWQPVDIIETQKDPRSDEIFAKVKADDVVGWVNIKYLYESSDPMDRDKPCF
jgi:hypothetical protein